jgi:hypothetical protein
MARGQQRMVEIRQAGDQCGARPAAAYNHDRDAIAQHPVLDSVRS